MKSKSRKIKFTGRDPNYSYYMSKDGPVVRKKWGPTAERAKKDPKLIKVYQNREEFKHCGKATKVFRLAFREFFESVCDHRVTGRIQGLLIAIKNLDLDSKQGNRKVEKGMHAGARALLRNFQFNSKARFDMLVTKAVGVDVKKGTISIREFNAKLDGKRPKNATHIVLEGVRARINFTKEDPEVFYTSRILIELLNRNQDIVLKTKGLPKKAGADLYAIKAGFVQIVNGVEYKLENEIYKAGCIVASSLSKGQPPKKGVGVKKK